MEAVFYLYTIFIMLVCIAAGTLAIAAYFVNRNRMNLFVMAFFLFYFLDMALIFQSEYFGQNLPFSMEVFYDIEHPLVKTVLAGLALESVWFILLDYLDKKNLILRLAPLAVYFLAEFLILNFMPGGPWRQFLFYEMRQAFLLFMIAFGVVHYLRTTDEIERMRLRKHALIIGVAAALSLCVTVENTFMILVWMPDATVQASSLPLYISERNFSENALTLAFAAFSLKHASEMLRLRFNEPPLADTPGRKNHAEEMLPVFCTQYALTTRERDVLALILEGKDNQGIASSLHLALGTVKTHTHNIFKKTGVSTRQELVRTFWQS
ncbi:MAG: helix-turn-helix transcriptional regulator [Eggerthellaceae bacterium]|nr:helix-turn-helix transcriptional regulator [Eggerthellaceae bacterium]